MFVIDSTCTYFLVSCSATPKLYLAKPSGPKSETESGDDQRKGNKRSKSGNEKPVVPSLELSRARDMAEKVKASTVMVSVGPGSLQPAMAEETTPAAGRKKEKKNKKIIRMAGGQIWEDNSLLEWEDGKYYYVLLYVISFVCQTLFQDVPSVSFSVWETKRNYRGLSPVSR
jgi:hypothetical protein